MKEKITPNMSMMDMLMVMSEGNPGALTVLMNMLSDPTGLLKILSLDSLGIRGPKIWMLYKDCSGENMDKFYKSLDLLRCGAYSEEEMEQNFGLPYAMPFLSDSVKEEDYAKDGEPLTPFSEGWNDYVQANRSTIIPRLEELKKKDGGFRRH